MAFDFKKAAQKATVLSPLMEGREKLDTDNIVKQELTITAVDWVQQNEGTEYPCILFKEYPNGYYCGGIILKKIVAEWVSTFSGNIDGLNEELEKAGGVKIRLTNGKTKTNNNLVKVEIL